MAGNRDTPEDGPASDPLHRGLFREQALAHYERLGGDPVASEGGDGGPARQWWRAAGLLLAVCMALLAAFALLVRVPLTGVVPAAVAGGAGRVVAVLPATQAERVRQGVTVQVAVPGRAAAVPVVLHGDGRVLSAAQVVAAVPALAGALGLPARGVLAAGTAPASLAVRAGRSLLLTAWADLGDQPLIRLAGSSGVRT
jgi:hypothetical protein